MDRASVWMHGVEEVFTKDDFEVQVNAEEFSLKNDFKFRLVCGSCNSPVTFVSKRNGQKYFKHPKRSKKEIEEQKINDLTCEKRINNIKPTQIKKYNQIIEQTTLGEITSNFEQIFKNLNEWPESNIQELISQSESKLVVDTFSKLEKSIISEKLDLTLNKEYEKALKFNKLSSEEKFIYFLKIADKESDLEFNSLSLELFPENILISNLAAQLKSWEKNPTQYIEEERDIFPILVKQRLKILPKLFRMLSHKNSKEMRYFLTWCELVLFWNNNLVRKLNYSHYESLDDNDAYKLLFYLSKYLMLNTTKDRYEEDQLKALDNEQNYCFKQLNRILKKYSHGFICMRIWIANCLMRYTSTEFYAAIEKTNKDQEEIQKGKRGYIYIATNQSLRKRGINEEIKIGKTKNKPKRLAQYKFASADGFNYEMHWEVKDRHLAEKQVHNALRKFRIMNEKGGKEWFKLTVEEGILKVSKLIEIFREKYGYFDDKYSTGRGF